MSLFTIEFDTDLEQATWAAAAIRGIASLWVDDEMKLYQVELAAAEGVNNAASYSKGKSRSTSPSRPPVLPLRSGAKGSLWRSTWRTWKTLEIST